jgi:hypothetical protein
VKLNLVLFFLAEYMNGTSPQNVFLVTEHWVLELGEIIVTFNSET